MKKKLFTIFLVLVLTLIFPALLFPSAGFTSAATVIEVPSQQYPTIQSALIAASNGSTINVAPGVYNENITASIVWINGTLTTYKDITLQGSQNTVINGDVFLGAFENLKMDNFIINGHLRIGNNMEAFIKDCTFVNLQVTSLYSYSQNSVFSNLKVTSTFNFAGAGNTLSNSVLNDIALGGNGPGVATDSNIIQNNVISGGITTPAALRTRIIGNLISGSQVGINEVPSPFYLGRYGAGQSTITNNTITNCGIGINLISAYNYHLPSTITQNTIKDNTVGLSIQFGSFSPSDRNVIYQNSFLNNKLQENITGDGSDSWSYGAPQNGNYWSDYKGVDNNGDGIGDTPYVINNANQDNYPLMYPWGTSPPAPSPTPTQSPSPTINPTPLPTPTESLAQQNPTSSPTVTSSMPPTTESTTQPPSSTPIGSPNSNLTAANVTSVVPETNILFVGVLLSIVALAAVVLKRKPK